MTYMKDFYTKDNIVGYTGVLNDGSKAPTVYFVSKDTDGYIRFGHITQYHNDPNNVGRERLRRSRVYAISNQTWTDSHGKTIYSAHECFAGTISDDFVENPRTGLRIPEGFTKIHDSRNPFILVNDGCSSVLEKAIEKHPHLKPKCRKADMITY